jgi:xanthine permease
MERATNTNVNGKGYALYGVDEKPPLKIAIPLGLQHVLSMFVGNIAPVLVISGALGFSVEQTTFLVQACLVVAGLVSFIQTNRIGPVGCGLPVIMGTAFTFVPTSLAIGAQYGYSAILGASLIGGLFETVLGSFLKTLRKFLPPLVTGTVLLTIGLSLIPTAINYFAGGAGAADYGSLSNLALGTLVLVTIVIFNQYTKGFTSTASILIGLVVGYVVSIFMGKVDFTPVAEAAWFSFPTPLVFKPTFHWPAIAAMLIVYVVTTVESVGAVNGITLGGIGREATDEEVSGCIIGDGLGSSIAAIFNTLPNTTFNQNVGIIAFTRVASRYVVQIGAGFLVLMGLVPKLGAVVSVMHPSVLGGAGMVMFTMICSLGIQMISRSEASNRNLLIVAISLGLGLGLGGSPQALAQFPESIRLIFGSSGIVVAALVAIILNIIFPKDKSEETVSEDVTVGQEA